jgi:hypothetical protein
MPEDIIGIRFNPPEGTSPFSMTWSFWTNRAPVWGDFFAKDGGSNVGYNYNKDAYDVEHGFLDLDNNNTVRDDPDPAVAPSNGSVDSHILRPDSLVPEPCALGMLATVAAGLMICLLRRRRHT